MPPPPAPLEIAVIGAGAVGLATALTCALDGHRVTLFDPAPVGSGASGGNACTFATYASVPVATPSVLRAVPSMMLAPGGPLAVRWGHLPRMTRWLGHFLRSGTAARVERISIDLHSLLDRAVAAWAPLIAAAGAEPLIRRNGALYLYGSAKAMAAAMPDIKLRRRRGVPLELLDADAVGQMEPALARLYAGGLFFPEASQTLDPAALCRALLAAVLERGGRLEAARVTALSTDPDGRHRLRTEAGTEHAVDRLAIAAGAWSKALAGQIGRPPLLDTERGYHLLYPDLRDALSRPVGWADGGFYLSPTAHGLRAAGTVELGGLDAPPNRKRLAHIHRHVSRLLPEAQAPASDWLGFRPSMPDSLPVLGPAERPGVYLAFGHGHLGLTLAGISGRVVADLIAGRDPGVDLAPFRPDRFWP